MNNDKRVVRVLSLVPLLASDSGGLTLEELARELGVSARTVRRDLSTLKSAGYPVEKAVATHGIRRWRIDPQWARPQLNFLFDEAFALYLGRKFLKPLAGTFIWDAAQRAHRKIRASLGDRALTLLEKLSDTFAESTVGWVDYSAHAEVLDALLLGIEERRVVFITYQSKAATERVTYDVHPYRLYRDRGCLYVLGYKPDEGKRKTWRVDRITEATVDPVRFTMPSAEELEAWLAGSFGIYDGHDDVRVRIRFSPKVARFVRERQWHPSQQLTPQQDGSLIAEFHLSSTLEIKIWILGFATEAQVLEPEELRDEIWDDCRRLLEMYENVVAKG